jgi:hypothetical protein
MAHRHINPVLWDDPRFKQLRSGAERDTLYFLISGPEATMLPGLQRATPMIVADGVNLSVVEIEAAFRRLEELALIEFDPANKIVRIPDAPHAAPFDDLPASSKVVKGWFNLWKMLPPSPLKTKHIDSLHKALMLRRESVPAGKADWTIGAWAETFGKFESEPNRKRTDSESVPKTFQIDSSEADPEAEADLPPTPLTGAPVAVATVGGSSPPAPKDPSQPEPAPASEFDRYVEAFKAKFGATAPDAGSKAQRNFRRMREKHSLEQLLTALDGLAADAYVRDQARWSLAKTLTPEGYDRGTRPAAKGTTGPIDSKAKRPTPFAPPGPVTPPVVTDPDAFNGLPAKVTQEHARQVLASVPKPSFMGGPKQTGT